jgi:hypothetical protein
MTDFLRIAKALGPAPPAIAGNDNNTKIPIYQIMDPNGRVASSTYDADRAKRRVDRLGAGWMIRIVHQ